MSRLPVPALMLAAAAALAGAAPAQAAEWLLIRWVGPQRCEVVTARPPFGRWEEIAAYPTRAKAEQALEVQRLKRQCRNPPAEAKKR